ncbi:MAG: RsbRD N-terminal domain-containing protein [Desulfosarcinaceae bacterium]|nr:RsbRD N-terminal domain-containing protein [Desulfosarcinaceae bacterium]
MVLDKLLEQHEAAIVGLWVDHVINTYAPDSAHFYKTQKDQFANPVGITFSESLGNLFKALRTGGDRDELSKHLDPVLRIRAIQSFTPAEALAFIIDLKPILRSQFKDALKEKRLSRELVRFEDQIDAMLLIAFDVYSACREKLFELKVSTEREKIYKAFLRAGLIADIKAEEPGNDALH